MRIHKNVLEILAKEASKNSILNLVYAIADHVSNKYDYDGKAINNLLGILAGDALVVPRYISIENVMTHSDYIYKSDKMTIIDSNPIKVDNITGTVTIEYKYKYNPDNSDVIHTSTFDISYLEYPDIIEGEEL